MAQALKGAAMMFKKIYPMPRTPVGKPFLNLLAPGTLPDCCSPPCKIKKVYRRIDDKYMNYLTFPLQF